MLLLYNYTVIAIITTSTIIIFTIGEVPGLSGAVSEAGTSCTYSECEWAPTPSTPGDTVRVILGY